VKKLLLVCLFLLAAGAAPAAEEGHLMRYADVHGDRIVFTYEDDLWLAAADGDDARRITNHPGFEGWAKFSPDGKWIAFTGQYDGGTDIYVVDARGGVPERLTFHPGPDRMLDWYPDGQSILFRSRRDYPYGAEELYRIAITGGLPERIPVDRGGLASLAPDASRLAFNRISREARTWKRHQGGTAQDVWLLDFASGAIERITDWVGTDNFPMWYGRDIYFTSDREDGTLNIYGYDTETGACRRLTEYRDYDVKYPSLGDGKIIFQYAETLHLLDLQSGQVTKVPVRIPSDRVPLRPELVEISPRTGSFGLSPSGKRVLLEARGEILNLPAEDGDPLNLSRTSASREKNAAWSPDGRWIAFVSDRSGEEQIYLVGQKSDQEWRQVTKKERGFLLPLVWSPDSKYLLFSDKSMALNLLDVEKGQAEVIAQGDYDDAWERWGIQDYVWSPCSRWIAYTEMAQNLHESIFLYSLDSGETTRLTGEFTTDWSPSFSPDSKYLYFLSNRTFNPIMGFVDQNHIFLDMGLAYLVLLQDGESPFREEDTSEEVAEDEDDGEDGEDEEADEDADAVTAVDLDSIQRRVLAVPGLQAGNYFRLEAIEGGFLVLKKDEPEFLKYQNVNDGTGDSLDLLKYGLEDESAESVLSGIANYHLSADGQKLIYRAGSRYGVVDAGQKASVGDGEVDLSGVRLRVCRAEEFLQIFDEAWRVQRDWFYDPGLHGVNWQKIGAKYRKFVPFCGVRADLNYLIGEMIGELNIGHTYIFGGDFEAGADYVRTGLLGVELGPAQAKYHRIASIVPGVNWDPRLRSPLSEPGCPISAGDYLIAIDGEEITSQDNVYRYLVDKADRWVTVTYNDEPSAEGAETYRLRTLRGEYGIRYRDWVARKFAAVEQATSGRIGYLHIPGMMQSGLIEFARTFFPQYHKEALIIDVRYNGGGFVGDMIIDRLERKIWGLTYPREGKRLRDPERVFHGPMVVLINEGSGSNAEYFAQAAKLKKVATVMGTRTWGGAIGIEPHQDLVDGAVTTPPQFGLLGLDGTWMIEGHGVEPDIEVRNEPADVVAGNDAQLDAAIDFLLNKLANEGDRWAFPADPEYPDKSKPGE